MARTVGRILNHPIKKSLPLSNRCFPAFTCFVRCSLWDVAWEVGRILLFYTQSKKIKYTLRSHMHVISTMSRRDLSKNARWRCSESEEDGEMRKIGGKGGCEKMKVLWKEEDKDEMKEIGGERGCEKMKVLWKEDGDEMKEIGGKKGCKKMKVLWKEEDRDEMKEIGGKKDEDALKGGRQGWDEEKSVGKRDARRWRCSEDWEWGRTGWRKSVG